jgi:hypothetical protein
VSQLSNCQLRTKHYRCERTIDMLLTVQMLVLLLLWALCDNYRGAIAIVAAIALADLNPTVITFGQPPVLDLPCDAIDHGAVYRFENSRAGWFGPTYDPVPTTPYEAGHIGHQIMLSDDSTGVAYIGLDSEQTFWPLDFDKGFASHRLEPQKVGYNARIQNLVRSYSSQTEGNVRSNGFVAGTRCSQNVECATGLCSKKRCK